MDTEQNNLNEVEQEVPKAAAENVEAAEVQKAVAENVEAAEVQKAAAENVEAVEVPKAAAENVEAAEVQKATAENVEAAEVQKAAAENVEAAEGQNATAENGKAATGVENRGTVKVSETMGDYTRELEASFRKIQEGDIISGVIIAVNEEEVILDLRYYTQGIIKAQDMSKVPGFSILRDVKIGDEVEATVIRMDDGQGNIQLSKIEANKILVWDKLEQYRKEGRDFNVKISGITNGGAICYLEDTRGFIPASQLSMDYVEDVNPWLHKTVKARVINVDRDKEKLVLSAKVILQEEDKARRNSKIAMIVPGSVLEGTVESLTPYGAFVNLGDGLSGLVHISQICGKRIKKPSEVLSLGDKVKAKVLNTNNGKISLSIKSLEENSAADTIEDFRYASEGELTTSLRGLFDNIKLD